MSTPNPHYDGPFYRFDSLTVEPCAVQNRVPIWVGGRSVGSLRRAVALADGWMPFGLAPDAVRAMLDCMEIPDGFEVVLSTGAALNPESDPDGTRERLLALQRAGATAITCAVRAHSAQHHCEQLALLRDVAGTEGNG
jgi:hypothetical protein